MTGLIETRVYRTEGVAEEHPVAELERELDPVAEGVFLAEEQLHPSLDEIFRQIDAAHRRTLELERMQPAHARHGSR